MILIFILHFIGDFVLQTREEGRGKSKSTKLLLSHTIKYSLCFILLYYMIGLNTIYFIAITLVFHTITDYFTSKLSAFYYQLLSKANKILDSVDLLMSNSSEDRKKQIINAIQDYLPETKKKIPVIEHKFWTVIGFDQLLHAIQLILTYNLFI